MKHERFLKGLAGSKFKNKILKNFWRTARQNHKNYFMILSEFESCHRSTKPHGVQGHKPNIVYG